MEPEEIPQSEAFNRACEWLYRLGALRAGLELHVWDGLPDGGVTAAGLAVQQGWDPVGTRALLDSLLDIELLNKEGQFYSNTPESSTYLVTGNLAYKGGIFLKDLGWEGYGRLAEAVRNGKRPIQYDATASEQAGMYIADYSRRWIHPECYFEKDEALWASLGIQARDGLRVLDLACGPAPISLALARKHPGVQLTWLDWEEVLRVALGLAVRLDAASQVSLLPGDLWSAELGGEAFDLAYLGNLTHFFSPGENTLLFKKVGGTLVPGGIIVVNSAARREGDSASAALWLYAATAGGGAYDFDEYRSMLEAAGFTKVTDIDHGPIRAIKS